MKGLEGRTVAVVGRAASLKGMGPAIEACDTVIRVQWWLPVQADPDDVGSRTDILYHAFTGTPHRDRAVALGIRTVRVSSPVRNRLAATSRVAGYLPTTGVVAIVDALDSGAKEVRVFGFDLYASGYVERSPIDDVPELDNRKWHDFAEDRRLLIRLLVTEPRFKPDPVLMAVLSARAVAA